MTQTTETQAKEAKKPILSTREGVAPIEEMPFEETLEAILFAAGHPMTYVSLAETFHMTEAALKKKITAYAEVYNGTLLPRGVMLLLMRDACQLCTKETYLPYIREALGIRTNGTLSNSTVETLAIIAYNQPVTRAYVDTVRTVDSSYAISNLLDRGLIECKGRVDAPGRPMLYGTSSGFLRCFGLSSLEELPGITGAEAEEMLRRMQDFDENQMTFADALALEEGAEVKDKAAENADAHAATAAEDGANA